MVRLAAAAAVAALAFGMVGAAQADERPTATAMMVADGSVAPEVAVARLELVQRQFDNVVEALVAQPPGGAHGGLGPYRH